MSKSRKVEYFEWEWDGRKSKKVFKGTGKFHKFGMNYEEYENGVGTYSTAIIELEDGSILNIPVENIKFIEL